MIHNKKYILLCFVVVLGVIAFLSVIPQRSVAEASTCPLGPGTGSCNNGTCDGVCCGKSLSQTCCEVKCSFCSPACSGKECGDDGCGGSCGTCDSGYTCSNGTCGCTPSCSSTLACGTTSSNSCGGICTGTYCAKSGYTCSNGTCVCSPSCSSTLACGTTSSNGCGGICTGTYCAKSGYTCSNGTCVSCNSSCSSTLACGTTSVNDCGFTCIGTYCAKSGYTCSNRSCINTTPCGGNFPCECTVGGTPDTKTQEVNGEDCQFTRKCVSTACMIVFNDDINLPIIVQDNNFKNIYTSLKNVFISNNSYAANCTRWGSWVKDVPCCGVKCTAPAVCVDGYCVTPCTGCKTTGCGDYSSNVGGCDSGEQWSCECKDEILGGFASCEGVCVSIPTGPISRCMKRRTCSESSNEALPACSASDILTSRCGCGSSDGGYYGAPCTECGCQIGLSCCPKPDGTDVCLNHCDSQVCTPGNTNDCTTSENCPGSQTCNSDGYGWGNCIDVPNDNCPCIPDCVGKECGPDGCEGDCGTCPSEQTCSSDGQCVCIPDCVGKECGPDGCGDNCGTCPPEQTCQNSKCVSQPCPAGEYQPHKACQNGSCVDVDSCGTDYCPNNCELGCPTGEYQPHKACRNGSCVDINSCGTDYCPNMCITNCTYISCEDGINKVKTGTIPCPADDLCPNTCSYIVCEDGRNVTKTSVKPCPDDIVCKETLTVNLSANPQYTPTNQDVLLTATPSIGRAIDYNFDWYIKDYDGWCHMPYSMMGGHYKECHSMGGGASLWNNVFASRLFSSFSRLMPPSAQSAVISNYITYQWSQKGVYNVYVTINAKVGLKTATSNTVPVTVDDTIPYYSCNVSSGICELDPEGLYSDEGVCNDSCLSTCSIDFTSDHPSRFLRYSFKLIWNISSECFGCTASCINTETGENASGDCGAWAGPISGSGTKSLIPAHSGQYQYIIDCIGTDPVTTDVKISPLPWYMEIIPNLGAFLKGIL